MFSEELSYWFRYGERGISSNTMVEVFEGLPIGTLTGWHRDYPHDPADFNRCYKLLNQVPSYRLRLNELKSESKVWELLVDNWSKLESLLIEELPSGRAPKLYDEMQILIKEGGRKF